jgi:pimeloyl-ACP methyl ester carboxylesterase
MTPSRPAPRPGKAPAPSGQQRRRTGRLRWRHLIITMLIMLLLITAVTAGFAWYATSRLIGISYVHDTYPLRILAVGPGNGTVTLSSGPDAAEPGCFRLAWPGGHATAGSVTGSGPGFVIRLLSHVTGRLTAGQPAGIEPDPYTGDPRTALGIPFTTVHIPTPLGGMPAWKIPGYRSTWVILIHGLDGSRADTLPAMPPLHALGFPILAITYRNDAGAPPSPDHQSHLGSTEWHDVAAAVRYATSHGASGVTLFGYSLGGAMALITAEDPQLRGKVSGLILDSPVLDWRATLDYQGHRHGYPQAVVSLTETMVAWRTALNYALFDQLQHEASLRVPVLLIQGTADTIVPPSAASAFAHARPGLVTYIRFTGADHVSAVDTNADRYYAAVRRFLARYPHLRVNRGGIGPARFSTSGSASCSWLCRTDFTVLELLLLISRPRSVLSRGFRPSR